MTSTDHTSAVLDHVGTDPGGQGRDLFEPVCQRRGWDRLFLGQIEDAAAGSDDCSHAIGTPIVISKLLPALAAVGSAAAFSRLFGLVGDPILDAIVLDAGVGRAVLAVRRWRPAWFAFSRLACGLAASLAVRER